MKIVLIVCLVLTALIIVGTAIYLNFDSISAANKKKKAKSRASAYGAVSVEDDEYEDGKKTPVKALKKLFQIDKIDKNIIYLDDGRMRIIMNISTQDFELLTDEEQTLYENNEMQFALSISSGVQFYTKPIRVETKGPAQQVQRLFDSTDPTIPEELKRYAYEYKTSLDRIEDQHGQYVRQSYCIIGVDNFERDEERAIRNLKLIADTVVNGLSKTGVKVKLLDNLRDAQLIHDILNRDSNFIIENAIDKGILELYVDGIGTPVDYEKGGDMSE